MADHQPFPFLALNPPSNRKRGSAWTDKGKTTKRSRNVRYENASSRSEELCARCTKLDFIELFTKPAQKDMSDLEEAFLKKECPLCRLVVKTVTKSYPDLDVASRIPWNRIFQGGMQYKIFSYKPEKPLESPDMRLAIDIWWDDWSQTEKGRIKAPKPDLKGNTLSFDLMGDLLRMPRKVDGTGIARQSVPGYFNVAWLQEWLKKCDEDHGHVDNQRKEMRSLKGGLLQLQRNQCFRLIDVSTSKVVSVTESILPRYFALSYQWGDSMKKYAKPDVATPGKKSSSIPVEWKIDLTRTPNVIQDTVSLLRSLGERYLWVDSICIVQSSPEDKEAIISKMAEIYHYAYATIVAASGTSDVGLARIADKGGIDEVPVSFSSRGTLVSLLPARADLDKMIKRTPWNDRGWTYQERHLSTRCIYFFKDEVICRCRTAVGREAYTLKTNSSRTMPQTTEEESCDQKFEAFWTALQQRAKGDNFNWEKFTESLEEYSQRTLTEKCDRLNAYSGILAWLIPSPKPPADPIANGILNGLPQIWFLQAMLWEPWKSAKSTHCPGKSSRIERGSSNTCFPTWSWAAWDCSVRYNELFRGQMPHEFDLRLMDDQNIALGPAKKTKYLASWAKWSPSTPKSCSLTSPSCVTLHICVPVIHCYLLGLADGTGLRFYAVETESLGGEGGFLGHLILDGAIAYFNQCPERKYYELAVLPIAGSRDFLPTLLIERKGDFVERMPIGPILVLSNVAKKFGKSEYLKLR